MPISGVLDILRLDVELISLNMVGSCTESNDHFIFWYCDAYVALKTESLMAWIVACRLLIILTCTDLPRIKQNSGVTPVKCICFRERMLRNLSQESTEFAAMGDGLNTYRPRHNGSPFAKWESELQIQLHWKLFPTVWSTITRQRWFDQCLNTEQAPLSEQLRFENDAYFQKNAYELKHWNMQFDTTLKS